MVAGDYENAALNFRRAIEHPNWTWGYIKLAKTYANMGKCSEALAQAEVGKNQLEGEGNPLARSWIGNVYALCDETERARHTDRAERACPTKVRRPGSFHRGASWSPREGRCARVEKAYEDGSPNMAYTKLMPLLFSEGLETDPWFQELLRRMDLL